MSGAAFLIAALVTMPAFGAVIWAWAAMARVEQDLRNFSSFEGMHFDS